MSLTASDFRIRDPFVLPEGDTYYLYGTTGLTGTGYDTKPEFAVYTSKDLKHFEGPFVVFDGKKANFWADKDYWAPEVWKWRGKYYLFAGFRTDTHRRAVDVLVASSPLGPFRPHTKKPLTPEDWECLDGTLYIEDGKPYMVFCHEWVQVGDGEMWAVELADDLSHTVGKPFFLFRAGDNPAVVNVRPEGTWKVTDGPFLWNEGGKVHMIWSSLDARGYAVLEATADSLRGAWAHRTVPTPLEGGHAMIFTDFSGKPYYAMHAPNQVPFERAVFIEKE